MEKVTNDSLIQQREQVLGLNWSTWLVLTESTIVGNVPKTFGIYKIRLKGGRKIPRLVGESEIVYLGRSGTTVNRTVRQRLLELIRKQAHIAWPRVERLQKELKLNLEFCYAETEEPEVAEKMLLMAYEREHFELPPLNHVGGL